MRVKKNEEEDVCCAEQCYEEGEEWKEKMAAFVAAERRTGKV